MAKDRVTQLLAEEEVERNALRKLTLTMGITVALIALFGGAHYFSSARLAYEVRKIATGTQQILINEIPLFQAKIEDRDRTIAEQRRTIDQAIATIQRLSKQVKDLGGDPGPIIIKNNVPPQRSEPSPTPSPARPPQCENLGIKRDCIAPPGPTG